MITISDYENIKVNANGAEWYTNYAGMKLPSYSPNTSIGRVDHYMKTSIKAIVDAYVKQVVKREAEIGKHILKIEIDGGHFKPKEPKTLIIEITQS